MNGIVNQDGAARQGRYTWRGRRVWAIGLATFALLALASAPVLRADDAAPGARAARLSSVDGQVQISKGNQPLAETSLVNTPLFEGTRVTTAEDGRAEIQFEDGSVVRISPNSSLTLTTLRGSGSTGEADITLEGGLAYFELQGAGQGGIIRVNFGDSAITPSGFTVLRINLDNPPGELAVFSGNAHLDRGTAVAVDLHGGESLALSADDISRYTLNETIEPDSWDSWNSDRDQVLSGEAAASTGATKSYGQSNNPAWSDLDANGNWYDVPGQGNVWSPNQASDASWDPYGNGNWMNTGGYGYTWISGYSWGYLPYQCGLWNWYEGFGWGWAPGIGGCNPWWGGGVGYYGPNIGRGYGGYRPPLRPHPPRRPLGGGGLIPVNRRLPGPGGSLPLRDKTSVAKIEGYTVQPMRPLSPRSQYEHPVMGYTNRTGTPYAGGVPATGQFHPVPASGSRPPVAPGPAPRGPAPRSPSPSPGRASAPPPASHASSGGGGGGGGHVSSGGGAHH